MLQKAKQLAQRLRVSSLLQQANQLAHRVCSFNTARLNAQHDKQLLHDKSLLEDQVLVSQRCPPESGEHPCFQQVLTYKPLHGKSLLEDQVLDSQRCPPKTLAHRRAVKHIRYYAVMIVLTYKGS